MIRKKGVRVMTTTQIRCFLAAARARSFSKAAQGLYMSQPTFGRQISALERELGFPLFLRETKGNTLTPAGEVLRERLEGLMPRFSDAVSEARKAYLGNVGHLTIGMLEGQLLDGQTNRLLQEFQRSYPEIQCSLARFSFHAMLDALRGGGLDIGITLTLDVERQPAFDYRELYTLPNWLVLTKDHPLAGVEGVTLADFSEDTFIEVAEEESTVISALMRQTCLEAGFEPEMIRMPDLKSQIFAVEAGTGIAAFNQYHQACNHPNLTRVALPDFPPVSFCAAWLRDTRNPAVGFFIRHLDELVQG